MKRIKLSKNFYLDEFQQSATAARHGIDMSIQPGGIIHANLQHLCRAVLQPARNHFGPIYIISGYRPTALNKRIGGSSNSQHITGQAADIRVPGHSPLEVARWIRDNCPEFDQVIHEFGEWVHVSISPASRQPRNQTLTAFKMPRSFGRLKTVYTNGLITIKRAKVGS